MIKKYKFTIGVLAIIAVGLLIYAFTGSEKVKIKGNYFKNNRSVYYKEESDHFYKKLWGADENSFGVLSVLYGKDSDSLYFKNKKVKGVDLENYELFGNYVKDAKNVYYNGKKLRNINVADFKVLGSEYAKDDKNIYYAGKKLKEVDYKSFMAMESGYARDLNNIFYHEDVIKNVDIKSFKLIDPVYSMDKDNCYEEGEKVKMSECDELTSEK